MSEASEGEEPVTGTDRAEEFAEEVGVNPTAEEIAEYQRLEGDAAAPVDDEAPEPLEPPD
ncbi:MAG TPA: hypothetical protein VGP02_06500 [Mycobacteriales bacterium]|jgi:hypothetical protein|nr:hypothetical protein [Mycobacteriales bacterium]